MNDLKMVPVESSNIAAIGHDGEETMQVQFKNGGLYRYDGVPHDNFLELMGSDSKGKALRELGITGKKVMPDVEESVE